MRTYTFGEKKGLKWAENRSSKLLIGLCVVALGLLIYDYAQLGSLMTFVFTGVK